MTNSDLITSQNNEQKDKPELSIKEFEDLNFGFNYFLPYNITKILMALIEFNGCCSEKDLADYFHYTRSAITIRLSQMDQWVLIDPSLKAKKDLYAKMSFIKYPFGDLNAIGRPIFILPLVKIFTICLKRVKIALFILKQMSLGIFPLDPIHLELIYDAFRFAHPIPVFLSNILSKKVDTLTIDETPEYFVLHDLNNMSIHYPDFKLLESDPDNLSDSTFYVNTFEALHIWKRYIREYSYMRADSTYQRLTRISDVLINVQPFVLFDNVNTFKIPDISQQIIYLTQRLNLIHSFTVKILELANKRQNILKFSKPKTAAPRIYPFDSIVQFFRKYTRTLDIAEKVIIILHNFEYYFPKFIKRTIKNPDFVNKAVFILPENASFDIKTSLPISIVKTKIPMVISNLIIFQFNELVTTIMEFSRKVDEVYHAYYIVDPDHVSSIIHNLGSLQTYLK